MPKLTTLYQVRSFPDAPDYMRKALQEYPITDVVRALKEGLLDQADDCEEVARYSLPEKAVNLRNAASHWRELCDVLNNKGFVAYLSRITPQIE